MDGGWSQLHSTTEMGSQFEEHFRRKGKGCQVDTSSRCLLSIPRKSRVRIWEGRKRSLNFGSMGCASSCGCNGANWG